MKSHDEIRQRIKGPVIPLPTVFTRTGDIDDASIRNVIDRAIDGGCGVIMLTWGSSLISLLTDDELVQLHRTVIDHVKDRALTIAVDNNWGVGKTIEFGRYVNDLGFDLYMVRPGEGMLRDPSNPLGWSTTPEAQANFSRAVARVTRVMLVGDVPIRTCELLEDEPNILAFKEDLGTDFAHEVVMRWGDRWPMVAGGGMMRHLLLWPAGHCNAWLDVFVHCFPQISQAYWSALQRGDPSEAWRVVLKYEISITRRFNDFAAGNDGLEHAIMEIGGTAARWRRSPVPNPTDAQMDELRQFLHEIGLV